MPLDSQGFIRCQKCKGQLLPSGIEVHRYVCSDCGQEYHAILQFVLVDPIRRNEGLLESDADGSSTSSGGGKVPTTIR
jgi:DNA-directed RNA polymerase subunit M/transcription elongation factor TFIIS